MVIKSGIISILLIFFGIILNDLIEKFTASHVDFGNLPQQISMLLIVMLFVFVVIYFTRIEKKIEEKIDKLKTGKFECTSIKNYEERLNLITDCIRKAKESIYILSDLSYSSESEKPVHKNYIKELNRVLEQKPELEFTRFIIPLKDVDDSYTEADFIKDTIGLKAYKEHFNIINRTRDRSLIGLKEGGQKGISIMLIDDYYLFFIIEKYFKDKFLKALIGGGLFFEDFSKNLTSQFISCFDKLKTGCVVIE